MNNKLLFLPAALIALALSIPASGQEIDTLNSIVRFISWKKTMDKGIEGSFSGMKGDIRFNPESPAGSGFNVCIDVATIDTGNKMRDGHLKAKGFFHEEEFPVICFESSSVSKKEDSFVALGELQIKGHTAEVELPFTFSDNTFRGNLDIDRFEFGIGEGYKGTAIIGQFVRVEITCVVK